MSEMEKEECSICSCCPHWLREGSRIYHCSRGITDVHDCNFVTDDLVCTWCVRSGVNDV